MKITTTDLLFVAVIFNILLTTNIINVEPAERYWNNTFTTYASGFYVPDCGFFVDTRGRFIEDINKTVEHESLHALIRQDAESQKHFCGEE